MRQDETGHRRTNQGVEETLLMLETLVLEEDGVGSEGKLAASCSDIIIAASDDKAAAATTSSTGKQETDLEANRSADNSEKSIEARNSIGTAEIFQDEIVCAHDPAPTSSMLQRLGFTAKMQLLTSAANKSRPSTAIFADEEPTIETPSLPHLARRESVPGAHRISRGSDTLAAAATESCRDIMMDNSITITSERISQEGSCSSSGLVEAKPVNDDAPQEELPRAVGMDQRLLHRAKPNANWCKLGLGFVMLLMIIVVSCSLIAFLDQRERGHADAPSDIATTSSPTQAPTSLEAHVLSLLSDNTIYFIQEEGSPQARAFDWLMEDIQYNPQHLEDQIRQRFAMATLYYATVGETWFQQEHWLSHDYDECRWFQQSNFASKGIMAGLYPGYLSEFFPSDDEPTPRCNANNEVVHLWLDTNNLVGSMPMELYMLTSLKTMSLGFNPGLSGSISSEIGRLSSLEAVVNFNLIEGGTIPSEIGLLSNLRGLGLYNTGHTGQIPTEIWQLTNLSSLLLGGKSSIPLKGSIPSRFGLFSNLRWLHIMEASFTGSIPTELSKLTKLEWCVLEQNQFSGQLPSELGDLTGLTMLSLWRNSLSGALPSQLGKLTSMGVFTVRSNQITGSIPTQLGKLTNMEELLDLGHNQLLGGTIPTEIGLLTNLEEFNVNGTNLTGPIPSQLGLLTGLQWLGLSQTSLTGSVPKELASLQESLYLLELNDIPGLSGRVPSELCSLRNTCTESSIKSCETTRKGTIFDCTDLLGGCNCSAPGLHLAQDQDQSQEQHKDQPQTQPQDLHQATTQPCLGINSTSILLCENPTQRPHPVGVPQPEDTP